MTYSVSGMLTVQLGNDNVVIDEERVSSAPELAMQLVLAELLKQWTTDQRAQANKEAEITVVMWAEVVTDPWSTPERLTQQRMLDRSASKEQMDRSVSPYVQ